MKIKLGRFLIEDRKHLNYKIFTLKQYMAVKEGGYEYVEIGAYVNFQSLVDEFYTSYLTANDTKEITDIEKLIKSINDLKEELKREVIN